MSETLIIHAHPFYQHSQVTRELLAVLAARERVRIHSLYELYPDFDIDVQAEQHALLAADNIIWLAPVHWYSLPSLLKHWIDTVLTHGWAYGRGEQALRGKRLWWVASAGAGEAEYTAQGSHFRPFADFIAPIEGTARYCGMQWLPPFIVHAYAHSEPAQQAAIRAQLLQLCQQYLAPDSPELSAPLSALSPLAKEAAP